MATLTLKNVPDALHKRLKAQAERNHRSLNREAIRLLETAIAESDSAVRAAVFDRASALSDRLAEQGVRIDHSDVQRIIDQGRP